MTMKSLTKKDRLHKRRAFRVRKKVRGTAECPRICVQKSNANLFVQLIDDVEGRTLGSTSTISREMRKADVASKNKSNARKLGEHLANMAKDLKIERAVFDRGGNKYHGVLSELADAAREAGLKF